jgi:hypothetical protein
MIAPDKTDLGIGSPTHIPGAAYENTAFAGGSD